jgi:hypothetical protein
MPALILLAVLLVIAAASLLTWRWLESVERIKIAREKAGGDQLVRDFAALTTRVNKIEKYMAGEDVYEKGGTDASKT